MSTTFTAIRDGGATDQQGASRFLAQISSNGQGILKSSHLQVTPHATPNNQIDIQIGDIAIAYQGYIFHNWSTAIQTLTPTNNSSGNPRLDAVVAYLDLAVVSSASNNNPGAFKFIVVAGTPAGSPVEPNSTVIQAAVGAGNPYYILGDVNIPNGFNSGSTISNSGSTIIADKRSLYTIGSTAKYLFFVPGPQAVANDVSLNPNVPITQTVQTISVSAKTAPVGSPAIYRIWNETQNVAVASITLPAGATFAISNSMTNASLNTNDVLRCDQTAQGSTTLAADATVQLI